LYKKEAGGFHSEYTLRKIKIFSNKKLPRDLILVKLSIVELRCSDKGKQNGKFD